MTGATRAQPGAIRSGVVSRRGRSFRLGELGPSTCVIYVRLSQDRDRDKLGVARQLKDCRALAAQMGLEVIGKPYEDDDQSATNGKVRPAFEQMLSDLRDGRAETVIAWHQDRLLRLTKDLERVIDLAEHTGLRAFFVTSGSLDLSTPAGIAVARTVAAWSEYEGKQKSLRQQAKNDQLAESGEWAFSRRPYGYRRAKSTKQRQRQPIEIVADEADVVRLIFKRYTEENASLYAIAADLTRAGAPTHGGEWSMRRVSQILQNGHYAGINYYPTTNEPVEFAEGAEIQWEPLITRDTWEAAAEKRQGYHARGKHSTSVKHLLSGIARCGVCGNPMLARPEYRKNPDGSRRVRMTYSCKPPISGGRSGGGNHVARGLEDVDAQVTAFVVGKLDDPRFIARLRERPDLSPIQDEMKRLKDERQFTFESARAHRIDRRQANNDLDRLNREIDAVQARLASLRKKSPLDDLALAKSVAGRWQKMSILDKRRVLVDMDLNVVIKPVRPGRRPYDPSGVDVFIPDTETTYPTPTRSTTADAD